MSESLELSNILDTMDLPERRLVLNNENLLWMQRNLAINNSNNAFLNEALKLISIMLKAY